MTEDHKEFLDELRESGATNMFGATPYLMDEFGLSKQEARAILQEWMNSFNDKIRLWTDSEGILNVPYAQHPYKVSGKETVRITATLLASELERNNPRFDRNKFLVACGIEPENDALQYIRQNWRLEQYAGATG